MKIRSHLFRFSILALFLFCLLCFGKTEKAYAGSVYVNTSAEAASCNASNGFLPTGTSSLAYGKLYYLNCNCTDDSHMKKIVITMVKNGSTYDTVSFTANNQFQYYAQGYTFYSTGSYTLNWSITFTTGYVSTMTTSITVKYQVSFSKSSSSMTLLYQGSSSTNTISISGSWDGKIGYNVGTSGIISVSSSVDWSTNKYVLTLTPVKAGSTKVTVYAKDTDGNTITSTSFSVTVNPKAISDCAFTFSSSSYTYDGTAKKPTVTVKNGSTTLTKGTDYSLSYSNNYNAGTATLKVTGTGNYGGSYSYSYTIKKASMNVTSSSVNGTYNGSSYTIPLSVSGPSSYTVYYSTSTSLTSANYSTSGSTSKPSRTSSGVTKVYFYVKDNTGNYNDFYDYWFIRIKPSVSVSSYTGTYDGTAKKASISASGNAILYYSTSTELTYSNYSNAGSTNVPTRVNTGTSTVYYIAVPSSNADSSTVVSGSTTIKINRKKPTLKFSQSEVKIKLGTATFSTPTLTYYGDGDISYQSTDSSVASISNNGQIEIHKSGRTYIKAISTETTNCESNSTDYLLIVVDPDKIDLSSGTITLSKKSYTYDGTAKKPSVTVKFNNKLLTEGSDYKISYASDCKSIGNYSVTVDGIGNYTGYLKSDFIINPKGTNLLSVKASETSCKLTWTKQTIQTSGYQIQYSTDSNFGNATIEVVSDNTKNSATLTKLSKGKKYYIRIRTFIVKNSKKYYSGWSKDNTSLKVTGVNVKNAVSGITVSWEQASYSDGYEIYRKKGTGAYSKVKTVSQINNTNWSDTAVSNGSKYTYKVRYYKKTSSGTKYGNFSTAVTYYRLTRPTITKLTNIATRKIYLAWSKNSKATGYKIQADNKKTFSSQKSAYTNKTYNYFKNTKKGQTYYFKIAAIKEIGDKVYYSAYSKVTSVKISK